MITTLKLKVKRARPHQNTRSIPDLTARSKPAVRKLCCNCFSVTWDWETWCLLNHSRWRTSGLFINLPWIQLHRVLGPRRQAEKLWISQTTLSIIDWRRKAILVSDVKECKRLASSQWRALGHDKQQWAEQIALEGEQHLCCGEIRDAFTKFHQLRPKCTMSSVPVKAAEGSLIWSDVCSITLETAFLQASIIVHFGTPRYSCGSWCNHVSPSSFGAQGSHCRRNSTRPGILPIFLHSSECLAGEGDACCPPMASP